MVSEMINLGTDHISTLVSAPRYDGRWGSVLSALEAPRLVLTLSIMDVSSQESAASKSATDKNRPVDDEEEDRNFLQVDVDLTKAVQNQLMSEYAQFVQSKVLKSPIPREGFKALTWKELSEPRGKSIFKPEVWLEDFFKSGGLKSGSRREPGLLRVRSVLESRMTERFRKERGNAEITVGIRDSGMERLIDWYTTFVNNKARVGVTSAALTNHNFIVSWLLDKFYFKPLLPVALGVKMNDRVSTINKEAYESISSAYSQTQARNFLEQAASHPEVKKFPVNSRPAPLGEEGDVEPEVDQPQEQATPAAGSDSKPGVTLPGATTSPAARRKDSAPAVPPALGPKISKALKEVCDAFHAAIKEASVSGLLDGKLASRVTAVDSLLIQLVSEQVKFGGIQVEAKTKRGQTFEHWLIEYVINSNGIKPAEVVGPVTRWASAKIMVIKALTEAQKAINKAKTSNAHAWQLTDFETSLKEAVVFCMTTNISDSDVMIATKQGREIEKKVNALIKSAGKAADNSEGIAEGKKSDNKSNGKAGKTKKKPAKKADKKSTTKKANKKPAKKADKKANKKPAAKKAGKKSTTKKKTTKKKTTKKKTTSKK